MNEVGRNCGAKAQQQPSTSKAEVDLNAFSVVSRTLLTSSVEEYSHATGDLERAMTYSKIRKLQEPRIKDVLSPAGFALQQHRSKPLVEPQRTEED